MSNWRRVILIVTALAFTAALFVICGCTAQKPQKVERYGMVIGLKPEKIAEYKKLHANAWPPVLEQIKKSNIRNYSIYLKEIEPGKWYLFSYFEYVGNDFDADMKAMAKDATTQKWWKETDPCQTPIKTHKKGEKWSSMEEVFYTP